MRKKRLSSAFESISKFVKNKKASKSEIEEFQKWIIDSEDTDEKNEALFEYWESLPAKPDKYVYSSLNVVKDKLGIQQPVAVRKIIPLRTLMLRVAVIILPLIAVGTYFYYNQVGGIGQHDVVAEIIAPRGAQEQTILSDGTDLWVNADSKVVFRQRGKKGERVAQLSGEAYFDVERQEDVPFIVETKYLSVKVLGTKFNVEAYVEDVYTRVTLEYGKIEVKTETGIEHILEPGQQLIYNNQTKEVVIKQIGVEATDNVSAWKENNLYIESKTLNEILQILSRAYNVNFEVDEEMLKSEEVYFVNFTRDENIDLVMEVLSEMVGGFKYQISSGLISIQKE